MSEIMWLMGDEDCGVSLMCRECDGGGLPIAYYSAIISENPYDINKVPTAMTIESLIEHANTHLAQHSGDH